MEPTTGHLDKQNQQLCSINAKSCFLFFTRRTTSLMESATRLVNAMHRIPWVPMVVLPLGSLVPLPSVLAFDCAHFLCESSSSASRGRTPRRQSAAFESHSSRSDLSAAFPSSGVVASSRHTGPTATAALTRQLRLADFPQPNQHHQQQPLTIDLDSTHTGAHSRWNRSLDRPLAPSLRPLASLRSESAPLPSSGESTPSRSRSR